MLSDEPYHSAKAMEAIHQVLLCSTYQTVLNVCSTSKRMRALDTPALWLSKLARDYPRVTYDGDSPREFYISLVLEYETIVEVFCHPHPHLPGDREEGSVAPSYYVRDMSRFPLLLHYYVAAKSSMGQYYELDTDAVILPRYASHMLPTGGAIHATLHYYAKKDVSSGVLAQVLQSLYERGVREVETDYYVDGEEWPSIDVLFTRRARGRTLSIRTRDDYMSFLLAYRPSLVRTVNGITPLTSLLA